MAQPGPPRPPGSFEATGPAVPPPTVPRFPTAPVNVMSPRLPTSTFPPIVLPQVPSRPLMNLSPRPVSPVSVSTGSTGIMAPPSFPKRPMVASSACPALPGVAKSIKKKKRLADKILPQKVRELVPESQAYMDLLAFERKLDSTIMRKRLDIQEALKRPMKQKRKLRIFISNTTFPAPVKEDESGDSTGTAGWELRVEGRLLDEDHRKQTDSSKSKRKFSSFFKSLVIELEKDLYGPDNHLVEWRRIATTQETDGFQVTNKTENQIQRRGKGFALSEPERPS